MVGVGERFLEEDGEDIGVVLGGEIGVEFGCESGWCGGL